MMKPNHLRQGHSSGSESLSTSSVVTIKRAAPIPPPSPGPRPSTAPLKTPNPQEGVVGPANVPDRASGVRTSHRQRTLRSRSNDGPSGLRDGVGNLNRWSQSTSSSISSTDQKGNSRLSRPLSFGNTITDHPYGFSKAYTSSDRMSTASATESAEYSSSGASKSKLQFDVPQIPLTALPPIFNGSLVSKRKVDRDSSSAATASTGSTLLIPSKTSSYAAEHVEVEGMVLQQSKYSPRKKFLFSRAREDPSRYNPPRWATSAAQWRHNISPKSNRGGRSQLRNSSTEASRISQQSGREDQGPVGKYRDNEKIRPISVSSEGTDLSRPRTRERREKDKKIMLSRALQRANTAVLFDNAQNVEGAIDAYEDACNLLQRVILRTSGDEDRRKLDVVWTTYQKRIQELEPLDSRVKSEDDEPAQMEFQPARALSNELVTSPTDLTPSETDDQSVGKKTAAIMTTHDDCMRGFSLSTQHSGEPGPPNRGGSLVRQFMRRLPSDEPLQVAQDDWLHPSAMPKESMVSLRPPMDKDFIPPPLSPRRSPLGEPLAEAIHEDPSALRDSPPIQETKAIDKQTYGYYHDSMSWLDTIDESGDSSCSSSVHSISSRNGLHRRHLRDVSGGTEAEFDAALDAAVEAAYDDGYEPYDLEKVQPGYLSDGALRAMRNVQLAKEKVREAEREEALQLAGMREREHFRKLDAPQDGLEGSKHDSGAVDLSEKERIFDELTKDYVIEDFGFELGPKSAVQQDFNSSKIRQSDSSSASAATGKSSVGSYPTTAATSLSTVAESPIAAALHSKSMTDLKCPAPPPSSALSSGPATTTPAPTSTASSSILPVTQSVSRGVRSRRFSGQDAKQLKIEISATLAQSLQSQATQRSYRNSSDGSKSQPRSAAPKFTPGVHPIGQAMLENVFNVPGQPASLPNSHLLPSPLLSPNALHNFPPILPPTPALSQSQPYEGETTFSANPGRLQTKQSAPSLSIKKNRSTSNLKHRNVSQAGPEPADILPPTPMSTAFSTFSRPKIPPTPTATTGGITSIHSGGAYLFDSETHRNSSSPKSSDDPTANHPLPLEACPESFLLRPFWFLRCVYQTLAHTKGGYITNKLFVPREVWMTRGVRIKNVEEKISNCDVLTAGLAKLRNVDTLDADAVLEEMQNFELLLDLVQSALSKKVGSEVGVQSVSALFRDAATSATAVNGEAQDDDKKGSTKGFLDGWRKLRSKSAGVGVTGVGVAGKADLSGGSLTMTSVPMTGLTGIRFSKRRDGAADGSHNKVNVGVGPHAQYMSALARLCDSVDVLDQIARQVEDPGLKHSSPTYVGLELSIRHAAEFFGFYICRFIISDLTILLEKSIKRGTEFVLS